MMERQTIKETVLRKDVYGSLSGGEYTDDRVIDVIAWLQNILKDIPEEFRDALKIEVESVGGWEGEHHTEVELYYMRPETDREMNSRIGKAKADAASDLERHRRYADEAARRLHALG